MSRTRPPSTDGRPDRRPVRRPERSRRLPPGLTERLDALSRLSPGPEREALRQEVICLAMPMARRLARRFRNRGEDDDDLLQVATLGLVNAVDRFDPKQGNAFASFAVPTIVGELKRHFRDHAWDVHVPRRVQEARGRVRRAEREMVQQLRGRNPTVAEIATHTGLPHEDVLLGLEARDAYAALSLDAPLPGSDQVTLADTMGAEDASLALVVARVSLRPLLQALPERERRILFLRFFRCMTQHQIAAAVGVSQMQVSRLINQTCVALRKELLVEA